LGDLSPSDIKNIRRIIFLYGAALGYHELSDLGIASASQDGIGTTIFDFSEQVINGVSI
jgi:hypothetical protein